MAQNFLYMFEFVVDDLLITRQNLCAPEEYPTCCEISFRSSVFIAICDKEYGSCVDPCQHKCGKCCLFSLEQPVTDKDRVHIHVYKKKTDRCKFLIGIAELPVKPIFERVFESFNAENPNWETITTKHMDAMPDLKAPPKNYIADCYERGLDRREQLCPTSELSKRLLPLFNLGKIQTGNIVLIMRLVCNGPAIVSSFPFARICSRNPKCPDQRIQDCPPDYPPPCPPGPAYPPCASSPCAQSSTSKGKGKCGGGVRTNCIQPHPCRPRETVDPKCVRYFSCNLDKLCPCDVCEDDFDRDCPVVCPPCCAPCPKKPGKGCGPVKNKTCCGSSPRCKGGERRQTGGACPFCCEPEPCSPCNPCNPCDPCADDPCASAEECCEAVCDSCCQPCCVCDCDCSPELQPCFLEASVPEPGPEAYDEFEACLNGSGLTIRVLKDTHKVESVDDGHAGKVRPDDDDCAACGNTDVSCLNETLQRSAFARNHIKRRTGGHIVNHPKLPQVRANIKYSGNDTCDVLNYNVPFSKLKEVCEIGKNVDKYRRPAGCDGDGLTVVPQGPDTKRSCCMQVGPRDIKNVMKGINTDTRKKGIEVCYKTCDETDSDVFLVKLGSKGKCKKKKNTIEIELRTPKMPSVAPVSTVTTETYVTEDLLRSGKKKKGKKGKKGKGRRKK